MNLTVGFSTPLIVKLVIEQERVYSASMQLTFANGMITRGEHMASTMQSGSYATCSVEWHDQHGNPANVDGPTKWESSNPAHVSCEVATGNPQIANLHSLGPIGDVSIQATADADLGEGIRSITAVLALTVIGGEAYAGEITFSQNVAQKPSK